MYKGLLTEQLGGVCELLKTASFESEVKTQENIKIKKVSQKWPEYTFPYCHRYTVAVVDAHISMIKSSHKETGVCTNSNVCQKHSVSGIFSTLGSV